MPQEEVEPLKLLVVDDETDNLDLLYRTFRHEFRVYRANSAFSALQLLEQEGEMGIIISDQRMPRMKGTELLSRIAEHFPDTIRIVLTGYTDVEDLVDAINTGQVFKYITKPWNPNELRNVIYQASETYRAIKRRTGELNRALRRESVFNAMITAIRESLDYRQILQTIVTTLGKTFQSEACVLLPLELPVSHFSNFTTSAERFIYQPGLSNETEGADRSRHHEFVDPELKNYFQANTLMGSLENSHAQVQIIKTTAQKYAQIIVPLIYQKETLAILALFRAGDANVWSGDDQQLIHDVAEQAALAISQSSLYKRTQEQSEKMRAELAVARQIQMNLLRQSLPAINTVHIQAKCYPAREVGGDFFEVYAHPNGDIWLAVGDVSGKGVPAALFMSSTISVMRRELTQEPSPEPNVLLSNLNANLFDGLESSNCLITLAIARYNPSTGTLVYANAGHIFPMLWSTRQHSPLSHKPLEREQRAGCSSENPHYLKVRSVPLGILKNWNAPAESLNLRPGDIFLMTSDGLTEARVLPSLLEPTPSCLDQNENPKNAENKSPSESLSDRTHYVEEDYRMLRQEGLWKLLSQNGSSPDLDEIIKNIQAYSLYQEDDQTVLSMEVL